jgi:hypothetical protein
MGKSVFRKRKERKSIEFEDQPNFDMDEIFGDNVKIDNLCLFGSDEAGSLNLQNRTGSNARICIPTPRKIDKCDPETDICED